MTVTTDGACMLGAPFVLGHLVPLRRDSATVVAVAPRPGDVHPAAVRGTAARCIAGVSAVSWIVLPGFGAIDLAVTWSADWPQVLEAGWGLFSTVVVGAAFALVAVRPGVPRSALMQLAVASVTLAVAVVVAEETPLAWLAAALALETSIVGGLLRPAWRSGTDSRAQADVSKPLLLLAGVGVVPWFAYALQMWGRNREGRIDADLTMGIDHYAVQGALALALAVLPFVGALRSGARPFVPVCVGIAASYLGLVSFVWPEAAGGLGQAWSAVAIAWGLALIALPVAQRRRAVPARAGDDVGPS